MSRAIAYYISSHGWGHAARQSPVIRRLALAGQRVYIRTAAPAKFFAYEGVSLHSQAYDIGIIQPDGLSLDVAASFAWYEAFLQQQPRLIASEARYLRDEEVQLVVSDMPPVACAIAQALAVPCVVITHFTWDWVYAHYQPEYPQAETLVSAIQDDYRQASGVLALPFAHDLSLFRQVEPVPLLVNDLTRTRQAVRDELKVEDAQRLVIVTMGGMEWAEADLRRLADFPQWVFGLTPGAYTQAGHLPNCRLIPDVYNGYHDLLAHADVVVGKLGGSTVSEVIAHRTPMLYTRRDDWRENDLLEDGLRRHGHSMAISRTDFTGGGWLDALEDLLTMPYQGLPLASGGADIIAQRLMAMLG